MKRKVAHKYDGEGILASVSMWMPPAESSEGNWKLLIVRPLKALMKHPLKAKRGTKDR